MKYVLLFVDTPEFAAELDAMSPEEWERAVKKVHEWLGTNATRSAAATSWPAWCVTMRAGSPMRWSG